MRTAFKLGTAGVLLLTMLPACGTKTDRVSAKEAEYEVVSEGAASGAASETLGVDPAIPPVPEPLTATNADTTTSFTLIPNVAPAPGAKPGSGGTAMPQTEFGKPYDPPPIRSTQPRPRTTTAPPTPVSIRMEGGSTSVSNTSGDAATSSQPRLSDQPATVTTGTLRDSTTSSTTTTSGDNSSTTEKPKGEQPEEPDEPEDDD